MLNSMAVFKKEIESLITLMEVPAEKAEEEMLADGWEKADVCGLCGHWKEHDVLKHKDGRAFCRPCAYKSSKDNIISWEDILNPDDHEAEDYDCLSHHPDCDDCGIVLNLDDMFEWLSSDWTEDKPPYCEDCVEKYRIENLKCDVCDDGLQEDYNAGCCVNERDCNVNKMHTRCGEWNDDTQEWTCGLCLDKEDAEKSE
jgi:hypothetical protein